MKNTTIKRVLVAVISLAMVVAFFPLIGNAEVYAQGQNNGSESYYALPGDGEGGFVSTDDAMTKDEVNAEIKGQKEAQSINSKSVETVDKQSETISGGKAASKAVQPSGETDPLSKTGLAYADSVTASAEIHAMGVSAKGDDEDTAEDEGESPIGMLVTMDNSGIATVYAYVDIKGVSFSELAVDGYWEADFDEDTEIDGIPIDMKYYPVGYHTVELYLTGEDSEGNDYDGLYVYYDHVPTNIYDKPSLSLSNIYTGVNYFNISNYNSYYYDDDCGVYLNYRAGSGGWNIGYGPISYGSTAKKTGLAAACSYAAYTYYAKSFEYTPPRGIDDVDDPATEKYTFKGPASGTVSFKTGYAVTPIKSIKAKKVKQWCKKVKVKKLSKKIYWRNGYAGYGPYRKVLGTKTYKYWYTKVRVTVNMKYVPGIAGVYIGSKAVGGNKKTYTADFTLSGKKKGKKISVSVYSYMNPTYGGLSGRTVQKVKVKKK